MKSILKRVRVGRTKNKEKISSFVESSSNGTANTSHASIPGILSTPIRKPLHHEVDDDKTHQTMQEQSPEHDPHHSSSSSSSPNHRHNNIHSTTSTGLFGSYRRGSGRNHKTAPGEEQPIGQSVVSDVKVSSATLKRRSRLAAQQQQQQQQQSSPAPASSQTNKRRIQGPKRFRLHVITGSSTTDSADTGSKAGSSSSRSQNKRSHHHSKNKHSSTSSVSSHNRSSNYHPGEHMSKDASERIARAAAALDNQGNELFERGYFDKAMATYMKALKLKRRTFHSLLDDADDLLDDAILTSQEDDMEGCTTDENGDGGTSDQKLLLSMATSINNIGYLRQRAGDATPDETMQAYKKSLRIKQKILGKDSLSVGKTLNNIGSVHYLKGEFTGALEAYKEALQVMQSNLGIGHPDVATVWSNMGDVHLGMKLKAEALEHYRSALKIRWTAFGEHDPKVVRLLEKIAAIEIIDQMMASTPVRSTKNDHFDWDESDLYDLDTLPVGKELHLLRGQVEEDMEFVDLMEKQLAVDMVRDKVLILKGMRELMEDSDEDKEDGQDKNNGQDEDEDEDEDFKIRGTTLNGDDEAHDDKDNGSNNNANNPTGEFEPLADDRNEDRFEALKSIKDRLARIREQKSSTTTESGSLSELGHASMPDLCPNSSSSNLFGASFYHTQARMTSLSTFDKDDLKDGIESLRSALVLKKGIDDLKRSSSALEE